MKIRDIVNEDIEDDIKVYQDRLKAKFVAWVKLPNGKMLEKEGDTKEEAARNLVDHMDSLLASRRASNNKDTEVGFTAPFVGGLIKMSGKPFFARFQDGQLLVSAEPRPGYHRVSSAQPSPTGLFPIEEIRSAGLQKSARYDIKPTEESEVFDLIHHSDVLGTWDNLTRRVPSLTIQVSGRNLSSTTESSLREFAPDSGGDGGGDSWFYRGTDIE